jgi:hypothetical protein
MDATGVAGAGGTPGSGGGAPALGTLFCGDTPIGYRYTLMVQVSVSGSAPPFMKLSTWNCGPGTSQTVTMTPSAEGAVGGGAFVFPGTINYLMATASDDSTFPALGAEFAGYRLRTDLTVSAWAKAGASVPPGFGSGGAALIRIAVGASASEASPCNSTAGVTFGLESFWAAAHPEALVYYDQGNDIWSAASPTVGDHGAAIVLTPAPPSGGVADRVHIAGTKAGCKIDTGTTSGALQDLGFTGNIPVVADSISVAQAIVGP